MENRSRGPNGSLPRIRVLSLGNCGVGKSCLIKRYCEQRFVQRYLPTIGIDYGSTTVEVDGQRVSVHFFDTSGNPVFEEVRTEFYPDMQGVMLVYDVTDRSSFLALEHWMSELRHNLGHNGMSSLVLVVVGTRSDTGGSPNGRQVSESDGRVWASHHNALHVVTSSALGSGVTHAFMTLFSAALQKKEGYGPSPGTAPSSYSNSGGAKFNNKTSSNSSTSNKSSNTFPRSNSSTTNTGSSTTNNCGGEGSETGSKKTSNGKASAAQGTAKTIGTPKTPANAQAVPPTDPDALSAIHRLLHSTDCFHKMQLVRRGLSKEEVNKSYRRLAALVHPDKCKTPGAEEAFKMLAQARNAVLASLQETSV